VKATKSISEVCTLVTDGTHYTPKDIGSGVPFLTVRDVKDDSLDFVNCSFISEKDFKAAAANNCAPKKGDILFSKDGTVGKVHFVTTDRPFAVLSSLAILRPNVNIIDPRYFAHILKSETIVSAAIKRKTGSAIRRIILSDLKGIRVSVPDFSEQSRIADLLDEVASVRTASKNSISLCDELTRSIESMYF
jgi:type I restriction enzyme, S subunit